MGSKAPKDSSGNSRRKCLRCGGSRTESETYQEPMGGASSEMVTRSRQVTCKACNGSGYA